MRGVTGVSAAVVTDGKPPTRVVMLVDNAVDGDSRVQKVAVAAAAAGYDVTLLGVAKGGRPATWRLGDAEVRLLKMPLHLDARPYLFRRPWFRGPLAYSSTGMAERRTHLMRAWRIDLKVRAAEMTLSPATGARTQGRRLVWRAESLLAGVAQRWVRFRTGQLTRARTARERLDSLPDRLILRFWLAVRRHRSWRRLEPSLWDWELTFGPVIDKLRPDLIHAHDFCMLGVGARAATRAKAAGRRTVLVWDAHEYLPGVRPRRPDIRWLPVHVAHEREYAGYADAVVTVSDGLAELLQHDHGLADRPTVVLNAPDRSDAMTRAGVPTVRDACGLPAGVPLLVYSGASAEQRGLTTIVEALPDLPEVHAALVVNQHNSGYLKALRARAAELGVGDRVHVLPYVPHWDVVQHLSGADVGVIPIHHWPNHEIALITKFFEYSHAGLPIVVSDVRTMADTVRATGQGEVFTAEDRTDFVRAVRAVLAEPERYTAAYRRPGLLDEWTWETQAAILLSLYGRLLDAPARRAVPQRTPDAPVTAPLTP
jgi:glycogen(starch) synthase